MTEEDYETLKIAARIYDDHDRIRILPDAICRIFRKFTIKTVGGYTVDTWNPIDEDEDASELIEVGFITVRNHTNDYGVLEGVTVGNAVTQRIPSNWTDAHIRQYIRHAVLQAIVEIVKARDKTGDQNLLVPYNW